jgi:hypothetical protein
MFHRQTLYVQDVLRALAEETNAKAVTGRWDPEGFLIRGVHGNVSERAIQARGGARGEAGEVWNDLNLVTVG